MSYSNEVHRRYQNDSYIPGRIVGEKYWRLLERGWRKRSVRCMDRLHKIHFLERKALWRMFMIRVETYKETNNLSSRQCFTRYVEAYVNKDGYREKARQCQTKKRNILHWTKRWRIQAHSESRSWPGGWGPQGMRATGGDRLANVPNLRERVAHAGREGRSDVLPWYRLVGVAKTSSETQKRKSQAARKGKCPPRGTGNRQAPPVLEVRPGNRQGWWKRSKFRWDGRQLTLDKTVGSRVWWHTQGSRGQRALYLWWWSLSKTAPGSLSTGSPAGRTPPHGDGSMYSQAYVREESVLRLPVRAWPSVIVDTEKLLREADGGVRPWVRAREASIEPKEHKRESWKFRCQL